MYGKSRSRIDISFKQSSISRLSGQRLPNEYQHILGTAFKFTHILGTVNSTYLCPEDFETRPQEIAQFKVKRLALVRQ